MIHEHVLNATRMTTQLHPVDTYAWANEQSGANVDARLEQFEPILLEQMNNVMLLDRIDTKFVFDMARLDGLLSSLVEDYFILDIDHVRTHAYQTLYFDTIDFAFYRRHHAGGANRCKVRSRHYLNSHRSFFEVKLKSSNNRTLKHRIETATFVDDATIFDDAPIQTVIPMSLQKLEPKLWNDFFRITLVGKTIPERVTLDFQMRMATKHARIDLPHLVVAEVKQTRVNSSSPFMRHVRSMRLQPTGMSKYCVGVAMLYPQIKHNNFKSKLRLIDALMKG